MPRMSTGLRRAIPFQLAFDSEEDEYSKRVAVDANMSRAEYVRRAIFKWGWQDHLKELRVKQKKLPRKLSRELSGV